MKNSIPVGLTEDQQKMLSHIADYRKRTGKEIPTYEEMIEMPRDEFYTWLFYKTQKPHRRKFHRELTTHEERTGNFGSLKDEEILEMLDWKAEVSSKDVAGLARGIVEKGNEKLVETISDEKFYGDKVRDILYAKAVTDFLNLRH